MMRGTFANIRIKNQMVPGVEGGVTVHQPDGEIMPIYDAAMRYRGEGVPLVVFAGKEYGTGSSRDWAAKGTRLLGVRAVIAQSFERIHRSNLSAWACCRWSSRKARRGRRSASSGDETVTIAGLADGLQPRQRCDDRDHPTPTAGRRWCRLICRIDTLDELEYFNNGGILHYVLRQLGGRSAGSREFHP